MIEQAQNPTLPIHCVTSSVFCSDNLELMKTIESNTIDLIYCDILYGTGRNFGEYQDLKPIRSEIESHYIPRIKEMHRILKPTGSIYLQMDWRTNHWIRCLMDNVFGYSNFRNDIIWNYQGSWKKSKINHQNIMQYTKSNEFTIKKIYEQNNSDNGIKKRWGKYIVDNKITKDFYPQNDSKFKPYINDNHILIDFNKYEIGSVWNISNVNNDERLNYDTQKPKKLIERIIKASSNEGDLVADFYLGSGTTAEVCKNLNRNFIGCDINPRAIEITLQRLNNARS
ncbi:MAG: hypothetical protein QG594_834 [Bacteroidota bacterium]|nr:hypothetical protein [Bacteroidota bacterium]